MTTGSGGFGGQSTTGTGGQNTGGSINQPPEPGAPLLFQLTRRIALVDTQSAGAACGAFARIEGNARRLVIDLDQCDLGPEAPAGAVGVIGAVTVRADTAETFEVRVEPTGAAVPGPAYTVGPLQTTSHGFITLLGQADRAFAIEASGSTSLDVLVEISGFLVPAATGGQYVHLLDRPERWYASNPNDVGHRDPWSELGTVLSYPVLGADFGATGMLGAVHLGPGVWREVPSSFYMGPAGSDGPLVRWSTTPADTHFPWRHTSFFVVGAGLGKEVEMRADAEGVVPWDTGIEPWIDAVGYLSPKPAGGLVYRPLAKPLRVTNPVVTHNGDDVRFTTGLPEARGVAGTLDFDLPHWPYDHAYRYFTVMVGATTSVFPGALPGGLEGPDFTTVQLNQNGHVTATFMTRTDAEGAFVMRHYSYASGGSTGAPAELSAVSVRMRVDAVLTEP
ncbi:Hypothetical protein A7982_11454 [Minicystis rosea]|nr:Hypothetical protein A7982_11454 [Minicystis rosea]